MGLKIVKAGDPAPEGASFWLQDIEVEEVSFVKNPAVKRAKFQIAKSAEPREDGKLKFEMSCRIAKIDKARKQVLAYVLVPDEADAHEDAVTTAELEKAGHSYMKQLAFGTAKGTGTGQEHIVFAGVGYPIESAIDIDGSIGKMHEFADIIPGAWFLRMQVTNDETWDKILNGELTAYSMGGWATRVPISSSLDKGEGRPKADPMMKDKIGGLLPKALEILKRIGIGKEAESVDEIMVDQNFYEAAWDLLYAFRESLFSIYEDDDLALDKKKEKSDEAMNQFFAKYVAILEVAVSANTEFMKFVNDNLLTAMDALAKATVATTKRDSLFTQRKDDEMSMTEEQIKDLIKAQIDPLSDRLGKMESGIGDIQETLKSLTKSDEGDGSTADDGKSQKSGDGATADTQTEAMKGVIDTLVVSVDKLSDKVEKIARTPGARSGGDSDKTTGQEPDRKLTKREIPRLKNGRPNWAAINKGFAFGGQSIQTEAEEAQKSKEQDGEGTDDDSSED